MDGKEYGAKGSDMHDARAYTKVDAHTLTYTVKCRKRLVMAKWSCRLTARAAPSRKRTRTQTASS